MGMFTSMACGQCGIEFHVPTHFYDEQRKLGPKGGWFCPNGHSRVFRESESDKLRRERDQLRQQLAEKDDQIAQNRRGREDAEKARKRLEKRVNNGVCPCCTRSFQNLKRHMETKHPNVVDFKAA